MPIGAIYRNGVLTLKGDPGPWIENNRNSCLQVRSLDLYCYRKHADNIGDSIGELTELTRLDIGGYLEHLPSAITRLHKLERLEFKFYKLKELPENLGQLVKLRQLYLCECHGIKSLPNSIATLHNLTSLSLNNCRSLKELPSNLVSLTQLSVSCCNNIKSLPNTLPNLTSLSLNNCRSLKELPSNLVSLTQLSWCGNIKSLPNTLPNLTSLSLNYCRSLEELPSNLVRLTQLSVSCCKNIKSLPNTLHNLTSLSLDYCDSLEELPSNLVSLTQLSVSCCHNIKSLPNTLLNLTSLSLFECDSLEELPSNLDQLVSLRVSYCKNIKSLPNTLLNLKSLSLNVFLSRTELPSNLDGLAQLCLLDIRYAHIKCLPWSIAKIRKLQHLMLPRDFRLQTLPSHLKDSVVISVYGIHVRKSWKEVKEEMGPSSFPVDREEMASLHPSIIWPPGYLRLYGHGNLQHWISDNYNSHMLVQFLELENYRTEKDFIEINMAQLHELTHLYISVYKPLPHNYFATLTRLRHLSLQCLCDNFHVDSLSKLSNLETLHLDCNHRIGELVNISLPTSLKFLSLVKGNIKSLHDSLEKLTNLKTMDLHRCSDLELLPANLNFAKVRLTACNIKTLPTGLRHLEILYEIGRYSNIKRLVNLETLSITLHDMKELPSIKRLRSLQKLQLKDCFSLEKLPPNLDALVALCSLDVSGTRIKSLPESITKLQNLEHLILPKCFRRDRLPEVAIVDSTGKTYYKRLGSATVSVDITEETYYERMGYYDYRYETSTETVVDETEQSVIPVAVETCNKRNDMVPVVGVAETVIAEQTPAHDDIGYTEQITSKQDSLLNGRNELIYQNSQNVTCSSQCPDQFLLISDGYPYDSTEPIPVVNYFCSMQSPPEGLSNAKHLNISLCLCSEQLLAYLKDSVTHLAIIACGCHVKELPTNLNGLANILTLSIKCIHIKSLPSFTGLRNLQKLYLGGCEKLEVVPEDFHMLDKLKVVDIHDTKIKWLPWSIKNIQKLQFLFLSLEFRLETLPCQLDESVVISVDCMYIRKTWKELKEMGILSFSGVVEAAQNSSIMSPSYLRLREDPGPWIKKNCNLDLMSVRSLELELPDDMVKIGDSITEFSKLCYLYISGNSNLNLKHLPDTSTTLRHLSLMYCNIESFSDSLRKLSNLESLCLDLQSTEMPENLDLLVNLRHLSLQHSKLQSLPVGVSNLPNLEALDLYQCELESLPENLNLAKLKLKLSDSSINLLPSGLLYLEILHSEDKCNNGPDCDVTSTLNQLINLKTLFVTCSSIECLPSMARLHDLRELQLKDCFSLEALPEDLYELVKLQSLNISGTRIKSVSDSITKLHSLEYLILPKGFEQCLLDFLRRRFKVSEDDTVEMCLKDMNYESSTETRIEGNDIELDSTELENEAFSQKSKASIIDVPPHQQHDTQIQGDLSNNVREDSNPGGEGIVSMQIDQNDTMIMESEQGIAPCETQNHDYGGNIQQMNIILEKLKPYLSGKLQEQEVIDRLQGNGSDQISKEKEQKLRRFLLEVLQYLTTNMTLKAVAKEFQLSGSEFKRRKNYWGIKWPSSREKQQLTPKKRKNNLEAPFQSDSSLHNSASPINPAHKNNRVSNLASYTTIEPPRETLKETQHIQEHLDGADECTSPNSLQRNESSSSFTVKATYKEDTIKFDFSLSKSIDQLREEVGSRLELQLGTFKLKYLDKDEDWILITRISDLKDPINLSRSSGSNTVRLSIVSKT